MATSQKKFLFFFLGKFAVPLLTVLFGVLLASFYLYMRGEDVRYAQTIDQMVTTERLMTVDSNVRSIFHKLHEITNIATVYVRNKPDLSDLDFYRLIASVIASDSGDMIKDMALVRSDGRITTTPGTTPKRVMRIVTGIKEFSDVLSTADKILPGSVTPEEYYAYTFNRVYCLAPIYVGENYWGYVLYGGELYDLFKRSGINWSDDSFDYCIQVRPHQGQQMITWGATNLLKESDEHTFVKDLPYGDIKWRFVMRNKKPINVPENFRARDTVAALFVLIMTYLFWLHLRNFYKIRELGRRDQLTNTLNHTHFFRRADRLMRQGEGMTLYIMDLNSFKQINDTYGHPLGDEALKAVAARLAPLMGRYDLISRIGGDEFALLISGEADEAEAEKFILKAQEAVKKPIEKEPRIIPEISVGYALVPKEGIKCGTLYRIADERMYTRKEQMKAAKAAHAVSPEADETE